MSKQVIIVESPAKARTIAKIMGDSFEVEASMGHIRDLPKHWFGVNPDKDFQPTYEVPKEKDAVVKKLKSVTRNAEKVFLATDPDREGEAISWHLVEAVPLNIKKVKRVVFHEITTDAIKEAFAHPRRIDMKLVNAQQARRILDRIVGYKLSPLLWQKIKKGLSAGRVQSVALLIVVEREKEILAFVPQEYWTIEAELAKKKTRPDGKPYPSFIAKLIGQEGVDKLALPNEEAANKVVKDLEKASYRVKSVVQKEVSRKPPPPFITSTLQQEASRRLSFSPDRTMKIAQQLYEGLSIGAEGTTGLITYMRTDSTHVTPAAIEEVRAFIKRKFGQDFLPEHPRHFTTKVKLAQEAHEAIRPTSIRREPDIIRDFLTPEQNKLYDLIWKRMVASQAANAIYDSTTVNIDASSSEKTYILRARSSPLKFQGFLAIYNEVKDEETEDDQKVQLPPLTRGEMLLLLQLLPEKRFTEPPPRYTEATLIKALEENGIGRPSTYASIMQVIKKRDYVRKLNGKLQPTELGILVSDKLSEWFSNIINVNFTSDMEERLDKIARNELEWVPVVRDFYKPFIERLSEAKERMEKSSPPVENTGEQCPECGKSLIIKEGRFGKFIACSGYPNCKFTKSYALKTGAKCPRCGGELVQRFGKNRRVFYGCARYPECQFTTPRKPLPENCANCGGTLIFYRKGSGKCLKCSQIQQLTASEDKEQEQSDERRTTELYQLSKA